MRKTKTKLSMSIPKVFRRTLLGTLRDFLQTPGDNITTSSYLKKMVLVPVLALPQGDEKNAHDFNRVPVTPPNSGLRSWVRFYMTSLVPTNLKVIRRDTGESHSFETIPASYGCAGSRISWSVYRPRDKQHRSLHDDSFRR